MRNIGTEEAGRLWLIPQSRHFNVQTGKNVRPQRGGGDLEHRKRSSSLLFWRSWHSLSAGHSIFNLATALVTTSNSSSNKTDCGGKSTASSRSMLAPHSSEEDNASAQPSLCFPRELTERTLLPDKQHTNCVYPHPKWIYFHSRPCSSRVPVLVERAMQQ